MEEIIQEVVRRTRIPEDKARKAVEIVIEQLQSRVPGPLASQLRTYAGDGDSGATRSVGGKMRDALDL